MANRVLLLLAMASRNDPNSSSKILSETAGGYMFVLTQGFPHIIFNLLSFKIREVLKLEINPLQGTS